MNIYNIDKNMCKLMKKYPWLSAGTLNEIAAIYLICLFILSSIFVVAAASLLAYFPWLIGLIVVGGVVAALGQLARMIAKERKAYYEAHATSQVEELKKVPEKAIIEDEESQKKSL